MRAKLARASFVLAGSEFERRVFQSRYGSRAGELVAVKRLGVPPRPARDDHEPGLVFSIGTLTPKKGHDVLIHAIARLSATGVPARLVIVGEGPQRDELEALIRRLGVTERVELVGAMSQPRALQLLGTAAVFALCCRETPEGDHDCLPVALMDAMSRGVPCVSSEAFGIPELIDNGTSGLLVAQGDAESAAVAIQRLLASDALRFEIGAAGRATVREHFDLDRNTRELAAFLRDRLD
jgi:glycosyltransferase involved in cell wall biosynthesis